MAPASQDSQGQCFSKCSPETSSINTIWELVRNAAWVLKKPLGDSDAPWSLEDPGLRVVLHLQTLVVNTKTDSNSMPTMRPGGGGGGGGEDLILVTRQPGRWCPLYNICFCCNNSGGVKCTLTFEVFSGRWHLLHLIILWSRKLLGHT